jgi:hypothetical protein
MLFIVVLDRATATTWQHAAAVHAHPAVRVAAAARHHALSHGVAAHWARCMPQHLPASIGNCRVRGRLQRVYDYLQRAKDTNSSWQNNQVYIEDAGTYP